MAAESTDFETAPPPPLSPQQKASEHSPTIEALSFALAYECGHIARIDANIEMLAGADRSSHRDVLPRGLAPRLLNRKQAAAYVGVSPGTFATMVKDGSMPAPICQGRRRLWDLRALDTAIDRLSSNGALSFDETWGP
jgi:excisionase family DNA binding protein